MTETPQIALGTMHFGTRTPSRDAFELLDAYLDLGGTWIDTANCYAFWGSDSGHGGQSEDVIGQWLSTRKTRDRVRLSTKVGAEPSHPGGFPEHVEGLSNASIRAGILASLRRLGTEHVDMYWAHMEDRTLPVSDVADAFGGLVQAGHTKRIGLSNHPAWYVAAANTHAHHTSGTPFSAAQLRESYLHPRPDTPVEGQDHPHGMMTPEAKDFAAHAGLDLWAYTPLLTGAYEHTDRPLPAAYDHPGTAARLATLQTWAHELSVKPSQLVIAWLLAQQPGITPIIGVSSTAQVSEALEASRLRLPEAAKEDLDAAS